MFSKTFLFIFTSIVICAEPDTNDISFPPDSLLLSFEISPELSSLPESIQVSWQFVASNYLDTANGNLLLDIDTIEVAVGDFDSAFIFVRIQRSLHGKARCGGCCPN